MDEERILELLDYIESHYIDHMALHARSDEYVQAVKWAEQAKRWDLIVQLGDRLCSHYGRAVYPGSKFLNQQEGDLPSDAARNFWEEGRLLVTQSLRAARQLSDLAMELYFLGVLSDLSKDLHDFAVALDFSRQRLRLIEEMNLDTEDKAIRRWATGREIAHLMNKAASWGDFSTARDCHRARLAVFRETDNKRGIAEELAFMAAHETTRIERGIELGEQFGDDLRSVIASLWELSDRFRKEAALDQAKSTDGNTSNARETGEPAGDSIYAHLAETLDKLDSLT